MDSGSRVESKSGEIRKEDSSFLIAVVFSGMGAGFVMFWLTLSFAYSFLLCCIGIPVIWLLARDMGKQKIFNQALIIYIVSIVIGIGVGFGSSLGTGVPVTLF